MNKKLIKLTESDLHNIVKEAVGILVEGWSSYVDYYYPDDDDKEAKTKKTPEKPKKEPSKSSRVRRREYMKYKQQNEQP